MRRFPFSGVDAFTTGRLEGNSLAVLPEAMGLTDGVTLAVAGEFTLSAMTFVTRRDSAVERVRGIRTRMFRAREEMPFYGGDGPATGSAATAAVAWLVRNGRVNRGTETEFEQAPEATRPSRLSARANRHDGRLGNVRGGFFAPGLRGELTPP